MQDTPPHRIRRLRWQVRTPRADTALAVRTSLCEWLPDIEAVLAAAFSQHAGAGEVRHLGSLSLNLQLPTTFSQQDLMRELGTAMGQALHDATGEMTLPDLLAVNVGDQGSHGDQAAQGRAGVGSGRRAPLLCALQLARVQAPLALREALMAAGQAPRNDELCELNWLGQTWAVRAADVAHWLAWLVGEGAGRALQPDGEQGGRRAAAGLSSHTAAQARRNTDAGEHQIQPPSTTPGDAGQAWPPNGGVAQQTASSTNAASQAEGAPAPSPLTPSGVQQSQAQLLHYLRTGQFDWVLAGLPADQALAALRDAAGLWVDWGLVPDALPAGSRLAARLGALSRWLALLSADQWRAVQQHQARAQAQPSPGSNTASSEYDLIVLWPGLLQVLADGGPAVRTDSLHAQALWLDWLAAGGAAMDAARSLHWLNQALPWVDALRQQGPSSDVWQALLALDGASPPQRAQALAQGDAVDAAPVGIVIQAEAQRGVAPAATTDLAAHSSRGKSTSEVHAGPLATPMLPAREPTTSTGQIVSQAGLVLLHAYLPRCLDVLGLYPSGQRGPLADHLWPRAAAVLHWLATGQDGALECELGLIKPLLGRQDQHDEHAPLSHGLPTLLPHEREEADALLRAVLGHWRALKGTSVAGLRESFLQRRGWLETRGGASLLRVEPAPYDVLLGSLPWGMSLVRLPWMAQPLHVEWSAP